MSYPARTEGLGKYDKDERHSLLEKYTSHFIWKGCAWERVGDCTEQWHIDLHSIGHNHVSFPFSWAAQPGTWGPSLSGCWFSLPHIISNSSDPQLLNRWPEGSPCWVLAFFTASCLQLVWSQTGLISKTLNRGPEGSLCWVMAFSTASCLQLIEFHVHWVI